jgi:hypothetical protein
VPDRQLKRGKKGEREREREREKTGVRGGGPRTFLRVGASQELSIIDHANYRCSRTRFVAGQRRRASRPPPLHGDFAFAKENRTALLRILSARSKLESEVEVRVSTARPCG